MKCKKPNFSLIFRFRIGSYCPQGLPPYVGVFNSRRVKVEVQTASGSPPFFSSRSRLCPTNSQNFGSGHAGGIADSHSLPDAHSLSPRHSTSLIGAFAVVVLEVCLAFSPLLPYRIPGQNNVPVLSRMGDHVTFDSRSTTTTVRKKLVKEVNSLFICRKEFQSLLLSIYCPSTILEVHSLIGRT